VNRAIAWFAQNHVAANLMMIVILGAGIAMAPRITQEVFPAIELDMVTVATLYPGASPEEVEASITTRIEEQLQGLQGIKSLRSTSSEGVSAVTVELLAGVDARRLLDEIRAAVDVIDTFPEDAEEPIVTQVKVTREVVSVAVGGDADEWTLKRLGQQVRDEIAALPDISEAELSLARPYEISIEVSEGSLRRFGLTFDDVVRAVRDSSLDLPGGSVKTNAGEILLRAKGQAYEGRDFESIALVSERDGTRLSLGDVAQVLDGFEESDQVVRFDGDPAVLVRVYRVGSQKSLAISQQVRAYVDLAQARMPPGITLTVWKDESFILKDRLDTMFRNAMSGFCLVVLILALFLRLRLALWVSLGIPISFMGAVALMPLQGVSTNFVSLLGFIIVLGIVVDDAIVVGENTHTIQGKMGDKLRGAIQGAQTIVVPVTFGVLTTVAAFAPLLFLPGPMGRVTRVLPIVVISCLLFSLIESMFILPAHLGHGRKPLDAPSSNAVSRGWRRLQTKIANGLSSLINDYYGPLLDRALEWRYLTVTIALSLLCIISGVMVSGWLEFTFQESPETDFIVSDLTMAQGTPAAATAAAIERIEAGATAVRAEVDATPREGVESVFTHVMASVGSQPQRDGRRNPFRGRAAGGGSHVGEVQVEVVGVAKRNVSVGELTKRWREAVGDIPGAVELDFQSSMLGAGEPIHLELSGHDLDELRDAAEAVRHELSTYPGLFDIADSFRGGKQQLEYQILPSAEALGLTLSDLARQLRQGFYGVEAQSIQRGRDEVKVMVRYPAAERRSLADVERMRIRGADGSEVPFQSVARATLGTGFSGISHVERRRVVSVTADVDLARANANEIVRDLRSGVLDRVLEGFPGVQYTFEGEQRQQREFLSAMGIGMAGAMLVIYVLLAVPLRSYLQPFVIMTAIPFGFVGAALGHIILGYNLTMYSVIGLVALSGIVVNSSLVLVDYLNRLVAAGTPIAEAVPEAAKARFRAILLTSLTTFGGLTPMMLETSVQARFMIPMAISIAFGVVFASLITLLLVPCSYLVLEDLLELVPRLRTGQHEAAPVEVEA
jgi:multidrug efflux pump subunit AcrB